MSAGHTKGPLHVGGKDGTIIFDKDGWATADTKSYHGRHRDGEAQANALLYAAAPDLLAALTEILGPLNVCPDNRHVRDDECLPIDITMGELRKARAAIARATGGQS